VSSRRKKVRRCLKLGERVKKAGNQKKELKNDFARPKKIKSR
jgi:hypothetical protein